jgi:N-acetylneuraminate synthase
MYGSDQAASLAPRGLHELVSEIRRFPKMLGDGQKCYAPGEDVVAGKLRYW